MNEMAIAMTTKRMVWLLLLLAGCAELGDPTPLRTGAVQNRSTQFNEKKIPVFEQLSQSRDSDVLRLVSYNVEKNSAFEPGDPQQQRFIRLVQALKADIYALQEVSSSPKKVIKWFNANAPLASGGSWFAYEAGSTMTVSRFPKIHHRPTTSPDSGRKVGLTSLDVPASIWPRPLYVINTHLTCCGDGQLERQRQADSIVAWIRRLRAGLGPVTLAATDPLVILGDLNLVGQTLPLETLLTGNIDDETYWGQDAAPDGDGSALADLAPTHNGDGLARWTWRNDSGSFAPGRLDYILISDSVLRSVSSAVLNTTSLSDEQLTSLQLERLDVGKMRVKGGLSLDHLPLIADLRWVQPK
tara:strand:+ start:548 stop:1615 length:1068 start_codon:yes stop_codon:yes gene_type:complete